MNKINSLTKKIEIAHKTIGFWKVTPGIPRNSHGFLKSPFRMRAFYIETKSHLMSFLEVCSDSEGLYQPVQSKF